MFCKNCGAAAEDLAKFCENCGAALIHSPAPMAEPFVDNEYGEQKDALSGQVFSLGLTGLIFSITSLAPIGIILSAVGMGRSRKYKRFAGKPEGRAKAGVILARIGLVVGILSLVITVITVILGMHYGLYDELLSEDFINMLMEAP